MLADILDSIPGFLCGPESNIFCLSAAYSWDDKFSERAAGHVSFPCNAIYSPQSKFFNRRHTEKYGVTVSEVDAAIRTSQSLIEFVHWLKSAFSNFRGRSCECFVEKTPINIGYIAEFLAAFPSAIFVVVIRDARAVVSSLKRRGYTLLEAAMICLYQSSLALPWLNDPRVVVIRFEDLIKNPYEVVSAFAARLGFQVSSTELRHAHSLNDYRQKLPRVQSWRAKSAVSVQTGLTMWDNLSNEELAILNDFKIASAYNPPAFSEISFQDLQKQFKYSCCTDIGSPSLNIKNDAMLKYEKQSKNLQTQMTIAIPWDIERQKTPSLLDPCHEDVNHSHLNEFLSIFGFGDYKTLGVALEQKLSEFSDRVYLPSTRTYRMRKTHVDLSKQDTWEERFVCNASRLLEMYLQLLARRAQAKQVLRPADAILIMLVLYEYRILSNRSWLMEEMLAEYAQAVIGAFAQKVLQEGWNALPDCDNSDEILLVFQTRDVWCRRANSSSHRKFDRVTNAILSLLAGGLTDKSLFNELGAFIHINTGIVYARMIASCSKPNGRIYVCPLFPLFLLAMMKSNNLSPHEFQREKTVHLARETGGAGMIKRNKAGRVVRYFLALRDLPELPEAYDPSCFEAGRFEIEAQLRDFLAMRQKNQGNDREHDLVLCIRHDVDRQLSKECFSTIRKFEKKCGLLSSWFFKPETFDERIADELINDGLEVGYHASFIANGDWGFSDKLRSRYANQIQGCTFHGGFGSAYWTGRTSVVAARRLGYSYCENPADIFSHPYSFNCEFGNIFLTPAPVRLQSHPSHVQKHLQILSLYGGHVILEHHPDLFDRNVQRVIHSLLEKRPRLITIGGYVRECQIEYSKANTTPR